MVKITLPKVIKELNEKIPVRFNIAVMLFMACLMSYMVRVNLSINLIAMVDQRPSLKNITNDSFSYTDDISTREELPDYGPRYQWSSQQQSLLLGAYFWGYFFTSLPGGVLAERFGGRAVVGYSLGISSIFTGLASTFAALGFWPFYISRFLIGVLGGVLYPACHNLVSKWAPPTEKGKFISALMGGTFGTVITWPICGILVEAFGWETAYYVPAAAIAIFTGFWFFLVADKPDKHPRITIEEKILIEKSLIGVAKHTKSMPPVICVLTSIPFWALLILHYGNLWGLYFLITAAPKYMSEVLGFNLAKAGLLSACPYLARLVFGFIFGSIGDFIRKKEWLGVTAIRKSFCLFSHIIPGLFLIGLAFVGHHPYICVAIITLSLGFNGSSTVTNLQNSQDLAPNYAGTLYGTINFVGTTTGFLTPLVVGYFTATSNTFEDWSIIFLIGAGAYIVPAISFALFGSGTVQSWNSKAEVQTESENKSTNNEQTP